MKRLAHRNADVQLYTLEVGSFISIIGAFKNVWADYLLFLFGGYVSSPMLFLKIAVPRCTGSLHQGRSQRRCYGLLVIGCVSFHSEIGGGARFADSAFFPP